MLDTHKVKFRIITKNKKDYLFALKEYFFLDLKVQQAVNKDVTLSLNLSRMVYILGGGKMKSGGK